MDSPAFISATPLPLSRSSHTTHRLCARPIARRRVCRTYPRASLSSYIRDRAQADIALVQSATATLSQATLALTAAALVGACALLPGASLAEIPDTAPGDVVFDDAAVVQKSSQQLFAKAMSNLSSKYAVSVRFVMVKSIPYNSTPDEFAAELAAQWALSDSDVLFVASPKLSRAGVFVGTKAQQRLSKEVAESVAEQTYAVAAAEERYGTALMDVANRLIPVIGGEEDPGPPKVEIKEVVQTYKTKKETSNDRSKYITVVVTILVISVIAPLIQTYWYVRDD